MTTTATILSTNLGGTRPMPPRLIVIHTTESHEVTGGAKAVARYFANPASDASAHFVVDNADTVRCVPDNRIAYTALGANEDGLHVEIVGAAGQGKSGWADEYSQKALNRAAAVVRSWADTYGIPVRRLASVDVKAGKHGVCGHVNVSQAYGLSTHTDPGPDFPWVQFLNLVQGDDVAAKDTWEYELDNRPQQKAGKPKAQSEAGNLLEACYDLLYTVRREQAAQAAVIATLAEKAGLTPEQVRAAAEAGAKDALDDLTLTIT